MSNQKRMIGIGAVVVALGAVSAFGIKMSGRASGETAGDVPPGCGGPVEEGQNGEPGAAGNQPGIAGPVAPGQRGNDVMNASQKPFIETATRGLKPHLDVHHLTEQNVRPIKIWEEEGRVIVLMQQIWNGLPILGAEARVKLNADGTLDKTDQRLLDPNGGSPPRLTQEQAAEAATRSAHCDTCGEPSACEGCLPAKPDFGKIAFQVPPMKVPGPLYYRVTVKGLAADGQAMTLVKFVDTQSGEVTSCKQVDACVAFTYDTTAHPAQPGVLGGNAEPQMRQPSDPAYGKIIVDPAPAPGQPAPAPPLPTPVPPTPGGN